MNAKLFINYRREDTRHAAGRLYDRLIQRFGEDQVFMDIDQIEPGEDFVEAINRKVGACDIALVAIGPHWLHATDASGKRRLDDEEDFVRMEIVAALQRNIRVIPVLVDGAQMPGRHDLPEPLVPLSRRNAIELTETRFHADVNRLIEAIEKSHVVAEKKVELSATPVAPLPDQAAVRPLEPESKDPITPVKSTQATPATSPASSTSWIDALGERKFLTNNRWFLVGAIALVLLSLAGFLIWPGYQKPAKQGNQHAIEIPKRTAEIQKRTVKIPENLSTSAEPKSTDQGNSATQAGKDALKKAATLGLSNPKDPQIQVYYFMAAAHFLEAAGQGDAEAQYNLGRLYDHGSGMPKDLAKAAELYQKAADQGHAWAQYQLGFLYQRGTGVPKDLEKAAQFYEKAADQGHAWAQYHLGRLYETGEGVPMDLDKARELYQKAADQGNDLAIENLKDLPRR